MYRVLAARSLKFLEQREEDSISYQRQFKEARTSNAAGSLGTQRRRGPKGGGGGGGRGRHSYADADGGSGSAGGGGLRSLDSLTDEFAPGSHTHPSIHTASGGNFHVSYPDRPLSGGTGGVGGAAGGAVFARQVGEKAPTNPPLLGYPPKDSSAAAGPGGMSGSGTGGSASGSSATAGGGGSSKPHATILLHEKKDKSDQLNMRIAAHMDRPLQRSMSALLVDEAVQKRLHHNQRKKAAIEAEVAAIRKKRAGSAGAGGEDRGSRSHKQSGGGGSGGNSSNGGSSNTATSSSTSAGALDTLAAQAAASAHVGQGLGVWSPLGVKYHAQSGPDLDLPGLNAHVPLRELTRSRVARPPPLKESSEHRKKYEALVELFRAQRHRLVEPPRRDGQNGAPRVEDRSAAGSGGGLLASLGLLSPSGSGGGGGAASLADLGINPALVDLSTDEGGVNPANQSLMARLYQTHVHKAAALQNSQAAGGGSSSAGGGGGGVPLHVQQAWAAASGGGSGGGKGGPLGSEDGAAAEGAMPHSAPLSPSESGLPSRSHSSLQLASPGVSTGFSFTPKAGSGTRPSTEGPTSVARIAALQPRKWDSYAVRPLATSASQPNFERRSLVGTGLATPGLRGTNGTVSLASLPASHPAQLHPNVTAQHTNPALAKQLANEAHARERDRIQSATAAASVPGGGADAELNALKEVMSGAKSRRTPAASLAASPQHMAHSASAGLIGTNSSSAATPAASSGSHVTFASTSRTAGGGGGVVVQTTIQARERKIAVGLPQPALDPSHPEYMQRRAETMELHRARAEKRRAKEEADKAVFAAVVKQLEESRLDHLHRWRNAFDGTKQKMDRLLIKKLVSRAESRAAALDGGALGLEPVVTAVLSAQELSEVAGAPRSGVAMGARSGAGHHLSSGSAMGAPDGGVGGPGHGYGYGHGHAGLVGSGRENLLAGDFAVDDSAPFDPSADSAAVEAQRRRAEAEAEARALRAQGQQRRRLRDQLQRESGGPAALSLSADAHSAAAVYDAPRRHHPSGAQQQHAGAAQVILEETDAEISGAIAHA